MAVQELLLDMYYSLGGNPATGYFGTNTYNAVLRFQKDYGLKQDGKVGNQTAYVLKTAYAVRTLSYDIKIKAIEDAKLKKGGDISSDLLLMPKGDFEKALKRIRALRKSKDDVVKYKFKDNKVEVTGVEKKKNTAPTAPAPKPSKRNPGTAPATGTQGKGNGGVDNKSLSEKIKDKVQGFAWGVMDSIPGYTYVMQTIQYNIRGDYFDPKLESEYNVDFASTYNSTNSGTKNVMAIMFSRGIGAIKTPEIVVSPSGEAAISASGSGGTGTIYFADDLRRPYIRKDVKEKVNNNAPKTPDGKPIDPNTGIPIEGKPDLGHKPGNEFWREKAKAQSEGLTQKEFNDRMNNPDYYQLENPALNRSHRYEMPK